MTAHLRLFFQPNFKSSLESKMSEYKSSWDTLTGRGHNSLTIGRPSSNDVVLYQEKIRKDNVFLGKASHTFSYYCKREKKSLQFLPTIGGVIILEESLRKRVVE